MTQMEHDDTPAPVYDHRSSAIARREHDFLFGPVQYNLSMVQQPKRSRMSGVGRKHNRRPIAPYPVLGLEIQGRDGVIRTYPYLHTKTIFATAALLHAETRLPVDMIRTRGTLLNPLYGDLSAYCQQINRPTPRDPSVYESLGVFVFPDLSVRHEGMYIIEFTLWEVEDGQVVFRGTHRSNTFRVYTAKEFPGMAESTPINELLKSHGIRVRVARRPQGRRTQPFLRDPRAMDAHNRMSQYHDYNTMDTGEPVNPFVEYDDSRESTPESESEDEHMEDAMDIVPSGVPSGVPPGGILPIPMHSAPIMHYNNFGERPAYGHQPQFPFSGPRQNVSEHYPQRFAQTPYDVSGQFIPMPRMHLPHPGGNQPVSRGFDPVQESQHVSHPERRNGSEFRGETFFPPPNNQTGYPGYQNGNRW